MEKGLSFYILVPSNQCQNCINWDRSILLPGISDQNIYIISSISPEHFQHFSHVLYDKKDELLRLSLIDYSNKIIVCKDGKVQSILPIKNIGKQLDSLHKEYARDL